MRKSLMGIKVLALSLLMVFSFSFLTFASGINQQTIQYDCPVIDGEVYELNEEQKEDLIFMYQEEKMARDLYSEFAEKWDARIFENISASEDRHMSAIARLLDKYEIEIPELEPGEFENEELSELYQELLDKGLSSYEDALEVGRAVEIKDIEDLEEKADRATPDVETVFMNLRQGSENHLSSFERQLDRTGVSNRGRGRRN